MTKKKPSTPLEKLGDTLDDEAKELKREYRHFKKFRDENSLLFGVLVSAVVAILIVNTLFWVQFTDHRYEEVGRNATTVANTAASTSLQTARNFAVTARASNIGTRTDADKAFPLEPGKTLLVMDLTITNKTSKTQHLIPVSQLYVRSTDGDYIPAAFSQNPSPAKISSPANLPPASSILQSQMKPVDQCSISTHSGMTQHLLL